MFSRYQRQGARLTFSNIVATLALFTALGGVSWAATALPKHSVGKKQLKSNSVVSSKVKDGSLAAGDFKGGQFPVGAAGEKGPEGDQGPQGQQGAPGATTSVLTGRTSLGAADSFFSPSGIGTASATEAPAQILSPSVASNAGNLSVRLDTAPGPGAFREFTLRLNGADTAVSCVIAAAAQTCNSTGASVAVPAGTRLALVNNANGAPVSSGVQFGLTLQP